MTDPTAVIARRFVLGRLKDAWLGVAGDDKTYCPLAFDVYEFDPENPNHVAPWTPAEVAQQVGWVEVSMRQLNVVPVPVTSGLVGTGASERWVSTVDVVDEMICRIKTPKILGSYDRQDLYEAKLLEVFEGWRHNSDDPNFYLRQPAAQPPTRRQIRTEGISFILALSIVLRRTEDRIHAQETIS